MAALIGALRVSLSADTAAFTAGMRQAEGQASRSASTIASSLSRARASVTSDLKKMAGAFATGLLVSGLVDTARKALDYASSLGEVAQQLGVSTRALQVYRYVAGQAGIEQDTMDKSLGKLNKTLGEAALGAAKPTKALQEFGFSLEEIKRGLTVEQVIPRLQERLSKVESSSRRAAIETMFFGKSGQQLDTMLGPGSKAINELAAAAEELGIVLSDEQIQNADQTADRLAELKTVLEARIAGIVADNAGAIYDMANALAELAASAARATSRMLNFYNSLPRQFFTGLPPGMAALMGVTAAAIGPNKSNLKGRSLPGGGLEMDLSPPKPKRKVGGGDDGIGDLLGGGGGRKKSGPRGKSAEQMAREAERSRKDALRDQYDFESDQRRNQISILQAQRDITHDYIDRSALSISILDLEKQQELAANALAVNLGERKANEAQILATQIEELDSLKRRQELEDREYQRLQGRKEVLDAEDEIHRELLEGQSRLAETQAERRAVELRILDHAYEQERRRHQEVLDDARASDEAKQVARLRLNGLGARRKGDETAVIRDTMGPLESFMSSLPNSAAKANEAMEGLAVGGISSVVDGLADAAVGARSLGDVFKNVARQILADLARIQIQKAIVGALGKVFGSFGGGFDAKGFAGIEAANYAALGNIKGFARGGSMILGGSRGYDTNLLSLNGRPIARVSHGERMTISARSAEAGGARIAQIVPSPYFDVVVDGRVVRTAGPMAANAASAGAAGGQAAVYRRARRQIP